MLKQKSSIKRLCVLTSFFYFFGICDQTQEKIDGKNSGARSVPNKSCAFCNPSPDDSLYLYIRAYCMDGIDGRSSLDTFRLYVERHPFATHYPGEVISAIGSTLGEVAQLSHAQKNDFIENYNWLIRVQPLNMEAQYQFTIMTTLAGTLNPIDLNEAANMWYNISLLFPDTGTVSGCWREIRSIRNYQKDIPQDTTPFHKLTFPLQPIQGATVTHAGNINVQMSLTPNPAKLNTIMKISMSDPEIITLEIYDILGKKIKDIFHGYSETRDIPIDTRDLNQGEYFVRLSTSGGVVTQKLVVNK